MVVFLNFKCYLINSNLEFISVCSSGDKSICQARNLKGFSGCLCLGGSTKY